MKTVNIRRFTTTIASLLLLAGCADDGTFPTGPGVATFTVRLSAAAPDAPQRTGLPQDDAESRIGTVTAYRFEGGVLREVMPGQPSAGTGLYTFSSSAPHGTLYFAANASQVASFGTLVPEATTLETFLRLESPLGEMTADGLSMTGSALLEGVSATSGTIPVTLRRSVARLDLLSRDAEVEVHSVTLSGLADRGYVNESGIPSTPASASRGEFRRDYADAPLVNGRETLLYLCEQSGESVTVEVLVRFGGGWHRLKSVLPSQLLRNTVYTLEVCGRGAEAAVSVSTGSWANGSAAESFPVERGLVDVEASTFPEGVTFSAARDTVFVPHTASELRLVLLADAGSEVRVDGSVRGVSVTPEHVTRNLEHVAAVSVTTPLRMPGTTDEYMGLTLFRGEVASGRVVLVFEANPVRLEGLLQLDGDGVCDFGRYVDGELARITLPEGMTIRLEFAPGESRWMDLVSEEGSYRLLGGWKPNDPRADGRVQEGGFVIADREGRNEERYTVRRRNWGLPVVEIGGVWWCKYNLRGDARRFEDQVSIAKDPAADSELADLLATCDDAELLSLLGDQYQGGNTQGLPLRHDGTSFYHEGMASSGQNFGTLDPTAMAPDGYRVPGYADYAFFTRSDNYNIGGVGERTYRNRADVEITVRVQERDPQFLGHPYGTLAIYEFRSGGSTWVLAGLGHQWDTTPGNIARMMLLLATWGDASRTWIMEGYADADRPGQNWVKYVSNNSTKTRVLRCVKTPVEYMYE